MKVMPTLRQKILRTCERRASSLGISLTLHLLALTAIGYGVVTTSKAPYLAVRQGGGAGGDGPPPQIEGTFGGPVHFTLSAPGEPEPTLEPTIAQPDAARLGFQRFHAAPTTNPPDPPTVSPAPTESESVVPVLPSRSEPETEDRHRASSVPTTIRRSSPTDTTASAALQGVDATVPEALPAAAGRGPAGGGGRRGFGAVDPSAAGSGTSGVSAPGGTRPGTPGTGGAGNGGQGGGAGPDISNNLPIEYPPTAIAQRLEGTVWLTLTINADGSIDQVQIAKSSGHPVLDAAALVGVRRWRAVPRQVNGQPIASEETMPVRFRLP